MAGAPEYDALVAKVDAFAAGVTERRGEDLACGLGCTQCCVDGLTVSPVEAQAISAHLEAARPRWEPVPGACAMLGAGGACAIYPARPLVCRTQGLPLRYPSGTVPLEAVMARAGDGELTWCPLNFTERAPEAADVLDADRLDRMLGLVALRYGPGDRVPLRDLASYWGRQMASPRLPPMVDTQPNSDGQSKSSKQRS